MKSPTPVVSLTTALPPCSISSTLSACAASYGNADYDIRNSFNADFVWQTPWKFGNKYANGAFGGWTMR